MYLNRSILSTMLLAIATLAIGGCYDRESLIEEVRNRAIRTRLDELDLGYYRTTLPRLSVDDSPMEIEVDLFGTAPRHKIPDLETTIAEQEYRLRQSVVVALRQTTVDEIADPNLTTFRERLLEVVNQELVETPVETLGFRRVRFIPL